jgi:HEAT repeat protein
MNSSTITGREPRLSVGYRTGGLWKISPRRLATMLNTLPPSAISLPAAAEALKHENWSVRYNAARALSRRGDRDARMIMHDALQNGAIRTRASVARHLGGFSWFSAESLLKVALDDPEMRVREAAIYTLCEVAEPAAYPMIAAALQHDADDVRMAAALALRDRQDPQAVQALEAALLAADSAVRIQALEALGANHTPPAIAVVDSVVHTDPDPDVRYAATLSLLELAELAALPTILDVLKVTSGEMSAAILRGLFHATNYMQRDLTDSPYLDALIDYLDAARHDPIAADSAIWLLAWIRDPRAAQLLIKSFENTVDSALQVNILRIAFALMSDASNTLLEIALNSPDAILRDLAETLLDRHQPNYQDDGWGIGLRNPVLGR